jgi:hypothetical protein
LRGQSVPCFEPICIECPPNLRLKPIVQSGRPLPTLKNFRETDRAR